MANNPYTSQSISGYLSTQPPDDGSQVGSNALSFQLHIDNIGDPINTFVAAVNAEVLSAFGELIITTEPAEDTMIIATQEFGIR